MSDNKVQIKIVRAHIFESNCEESYSNASIILTALLAVKEKDEK